MCFRCSQTGKVKEDAIDIFKGRGGELKFRNYGKMISSLEREDSCGRVMTAISQGSLLLLIG